MPIQKVYRTLIYILDIYSLQYRIVKTPLIDKTYGDITMSLTLRINAVWLTTWVQPNTGNYKTINEVKGTLAVYWKWWDVTEFTQRTMNELVPNPRPCSKGLDNTPARNF